MARLVRRVPPMQHAATSGVRRVRTGPVTHAIRSG
jgi:hypothetical protein